MHFFMLLVIESFFSSKQFLTSFCDRKKMFFLNFIALYILYYFINNFKNIFKALNFTNRIKINK